MILVLTLSVGTLSETKSQVQIPALEERPKVACDRQAKAQDQRILGTVDQFVEVSRLEPGRIADLSVIWRRFVTGAEAPFAAGDRRARCVFSLTHGQGRLELVGQRRLIVCTDSRTGGVGHASEPSTGQAQRARGRQRDELGGTRPVMGEPSRLRATGTERVKRPPPVSTSEVDPSSWTVWRLG